MKRKVKRFFIHSPGGSTCVYMRLLIFAFAASAAAVVLVLFDGYFKVC